MKSDVKKLKNHLRILREKVISTPHDSPCPQIETWFPARSNGLSIGRGSG
jgi:hypothetical protein